MNNKTNTGTLQDPAAVNTGPTSIKLRKWKLFLRKNIIFYLITNVAFNSVIPYFNFENPEAVHLFKGQYCIARFLLPLAFFIPFLITIDVCNKIIALLKKENPRYTVPIYFPHKKFMFKKATINGVITFMLVTGLMGLLQLSTPSDYTFNGLVLSVFMGLFAGFIAVFFMMQTIKKLRCPEKLGDFHE